MKIIVFFTLCFFVTAGKTKLFPASTAALSGDATTRGRRPSLPPLPPTRRTCAAEAAASGATGRSSSTERTGIAAEASIHTEEAPTVVAPSARSRGSSENPRDHLETLHYQIEALQTLRSQVAEYMERHRELTIKISNITATLARPFEPGEKFSRKELKTELSRSYATLRELLDDPFSRYRLDELDAKISALKTNYDALVAYLLPHLPESHS